MDVREPASLRVQASLTGLGQHHRTRRAVYDDIVAGACAAGCVLAARLAEDPAVSVLLLEAGGKAKTLFIDMPADEA